MPVTAVQTKTGIELLYQANDYTLAAEAILRVNTPLRSHYSVANTILVLQAAGGIMSLTVHSMRAALEFQRWDKDITNIAVTLATMCFTKITWRARNANNI